MGMRMLWGHSEGVNKAWLGTTPYIFVSKASTVEPILGSSRYLDKSHDYRFLHAWLGTGLLTSSGTTTFANVTDIYRKRKKCSYLHHYSYVAYFRKEMAFQKKDSHTDVSFQNFRRLCRSFC